MNMSQFATGARKNPPWAQAAQPAAAAAAVLGMGGVGMQGLNTTPQLAANPLIAQATLGAAASITTAQTLATQSLPQQGFSAQQLVGLQNLTQAGFQSAAQTQGVLHQPGITIPTTLASNQTMTVSYPAPRIMQPNTPATLTAAPPPNQQHQPKQRVFTGQVTKLHDDFGFVDGDVFFQTSCVKGSMPKVLDRVLVEAKYNPNMPFKWNATRIQVLPASAQQPVGHGQPVGQSTGQHQAPPPLMAQQTTHPVAGAATSTGGGGGGGRFSNLEPSVVPVKRREPARNRERDRERRARSRDSRDTVAEKRQPIVTRKRSRSPRIRSQSPPRRRPRVVLRYVVQVPKVSVDRLFASVVDLKRLYTNMYIPSDFFDVRYKWHEAFPLHRPFEFTSQCSYHVMNKDVQPLVENDAILEPPDANYSYSAKVMLLSVPSVQELYHKSCALSEDSADIREDFVHPTRLISFLVGLRGKNEAMAIGGPWSPSLDGPDPESNPQTLINTAIRCCRALTNINLSMCTQWYRLLEVRYHRCEDVHKGRVVPARVETVVIFLPDVWSCMPTRLEWTTIQSAYRKRTGSIADGGPSTQVGEGSLATPTHFSDLDPKIMKVADLRNELELRTLSTKGLKSQLVARLTKALRLEHEAEEKGSAAVDNSEMVEVPPVEEEEKLDAEPIKEELEKKDRDDDENAEVEFPENPSIIVHPSRAAKGGKFDCTVMSLSVLLDYRQEDNKEHSFEVSLFAEMFNEMLVRDFGFKIYHSLTLLPDKEDEKKKEKKHEKDDEKDENKKEDEKKSEDGNEKEKDESHSTDNEHEEEVRSSSSKSESKGSKSHDKEKRREKLKHVTVDPALLLAFVYFDQNHAGYLVDRDAEDIFLTLGLHLSRSQIRKVVQKLAVRDTLYYRKLTDKPQSRDGEKEKPAEREGDNAQDKETPNSDTKNDAIYGNINLVPTNQTSNSTSREQVSATETQSREDGDNWVMYRGSLLDVENLMHRLERSEKNRTATEEKLKSMEHEIDKLVGVAGQQSDISKLLTTELKKTKEKLSGVEKLQSQMEEDKQKLHHTLVQTRDSLNHCMTRLSNTLGDLSESTEGSKDSVSGKVKSEPDNS